VKGAFMAAMSDPGNIAAGNAGQHPLILTLL
jgi:hypothetical protein